MLEFNFDFEPPTASSSGSVLDSLLMRQSLPLCIAQQARKLLGNNRSYRFSSICTSRELDQRHVACAALMLAADEYNKHAVVRSGPHAEVEAGFVGSGSRVVTESTGATAEAVAGAGVGAHDVDDGINGAGAGVGVKNGYKHDPQTSSSSI